MILIKLDYENGMLLALPKIVSPYRSGNLPKRHDTGQVVCDAIYVLHIIWLLDSIAGILYSGVSDEWN